METARLANKDISDGLSLQEVAEKYEYKDVNELARSVLWTNKYDKAVEVSK